MHNVTEVPFGVPCQTRLWFSEKVTKEVAEFRKRGDPNGAFWKRVKRHAQNGFWLAERGNNPPIRHEWDRVYRIGFIDSLFRIIGFYEDESEKRDFIAIDAFLKSGQDLNTAQRARIDEVARVRQEILWKKVRP